MIAPLKTALRRRGAVLIVVLVVVVLLSLGAYAFTDLMLAHREAADLSGRQLQARMLVDSGVESVRVFLQQTPEAQEQAGGLFDNPGQFRAATVIPSDEPRERACFSVLAPNLDESGALAGVRFGLEDESARLNLNALVILDAQYAGCGRTLLMALPGMTEDVADAILDWMDEDDEPRELGAEIDYYSGLAPAYAPRNGPLETVEELLLVRNLTPELLFGVDVNRNGAADPHELAGQSASSGDDAAVLLGWSRMLTLYGAERNVRPDGQPRVHLNQQDMQQLWNELSEVVPLEWATFIVAYRQNGPYTGSKDSDGNATGALDLTQPGKAQLTQVLDLIGAKVQVKFAGKEKSSVLASPFSAELGAMNVYLPTLMDSVTINPSPVIPGRININQAPAALLRGIPGMTDNIVQQILSLRKTDGASDQPNRRHETWLLSSAVVTLDEMRTLMPFINAGGAVRRAQVVGYFQGGEAASRAEVVLDGTGGYPRVVFWRDLSHLGRGYALETLGVDYSEP